MSDNESKKNRCVSDESSPKSDSDNNQTADREPETPRGQKLVTEIPTDISSIKEGISIQNPFEHYLSPKESPADKSTMNERLEEIAEDLFELRDRIKAIERGQQRILQQLADVLNTFIASRKSGYRQFEKLRKELLGEKNTRVVSNTLRSIVSNLDSLREMRQGLNRRKDQRLSKQLLAVESSLGTIVQGLGFEEFHVIKGEPFDPGRMECLGYQKGKTSTVLKVIRAGYRTNESVFRPAGVYIADPADESNYEREPDK